MELEEDSARKEWNEFIKFKMPKKKKQKKNAGKKAVERHLTYQKIATGTIGFFGMILIITNLRMTGAAVGSLSHLTLGILGMGMAAFALLVFLKNQKKKL